MTKQTALIIGASRGLGLGMTEELVSKGWNVIATERKNDSQSALRVYAKNNNQNLRSEIGRALPKSVQDKLNQLRNGN